MNKEDLEDIDDLVYDLDYDHDNIKNEFIKTINEYENKISKLEQDLKLFKDAEKETSDAYLRIRQLLAPGAFLTNFGGKNRYEVTENALKELLKKVNTLRVQNTSQKETIYKYESVLNRF